MDELTLLGNAAAVPVVIAITQLLKKNLSFKYKSDFVSFAVAIVVCFGWKFFNMLEPSTLVLGDTLVDDLFGKGWEAVTKEVMNQLIVSFATWLSASKSYDLFYGVKKREAKHLGEKKVLEKKYVKEKVALEKEIVTHSEEKSTLQKQVVDLEKKLNGDHDGGEMEEDPQLDATLRSILEG